MNIANALSLNRDYLFFAHGFSYLLFSAAVFLLRDRISRLLDWIAISSACFGVSFWFGIVRIALGKPVAACWLKVLLVSLALVSLLRFVQLALQIGKREDWIWPIGIGLLGIVPGFWLEWPMVDTLLQVAFLLPVSAIAAVTAWRLVPHNQEFRKLLPFIFVSFVLSVLLGATFNPDDTAISLWRETLHVFAALSAFAMCMLAWWLHCSYRRDYRPFWTLFATVGFVLVLGWGLTKKAGELGERLQSDRDKESIQLVESSLLRVTDDAFRLAETAAQNPRISEWVRSGRNELAASLAMGRYAALCAHCAMNVVRSDGKVALSTDLSFVGLDFQDRAYFRQAMLGLKSGYFGVSHVDMEPGFYATVPLRGDLYRVQGAIVVKVRLRSLNLLESLAAEAFLVDPNGAVLIATDMAHANRALWPMGREIADRLTQSKQFAKIELTPLLDFIPMEATRTTYNGRMVHVFRHRTVENWSLVFLFADTLAVYFRLAAIGMIFLLCVLLLIGFSSHERLADANAVLSVSERQYRSLFEQNGMITFLLEPVSGVLVDANDAAALFYGFTRQELRARSIYDLSTRPREDVSRTLGQLNSGGALHLESKHRIKGGTLRDVEIYGMKIPYEERTVLYIVVHDVSDRKRAEAEKKVVLAQLIQSAKLASIGTLAAGVAHEVNNPLAVLKGYAGMLRDQLQTLPDAGKYLENVEKQERAAERIASIVNGLRTYARADTEQVEPVNLHKVIAETLVLVETLYKKRMIQVALELNSANPVVRANGGKLQQVLVNFISNSSDALEDTKGEKRIEIKTYERNEQLHLSFIDNGCGMDSSVLARIGDPFFTTKAPGKGTGLGVSISRAIVESFGGTMKVESEPGRGTSITLAFPICREAPAEQACSEIRRNFRFTGRALVVDDEPDIREILREYLMSFGLTVEEAENGRQALAKLKERRFDVALLDIQMPEMSGDELLLELQRLESEITTPVIVVTGGIVAEFAEERRKTIERLASAYLRKPFAQDEIGEALEKVLGIKTPVGA